MKVEELMDAIEAKIKTVSVYGNRVYQVPSVISLVATLKIYKTPMVGIVLTGAKTPPLMGGKFIFTYSFDIFVLQRIWKDQNVIKGNATTKGLMELVTDLFNLLKAEIFTTELSGAINMATITDIIGTSEWRQLGSDYYSASSGISIKYMEVSS